MNVVGPVPIPPTLERLAAPTQVRTDVSQQNVVGTVRGAWNSSTIGWAARSWKGLSRSRSSSAQTPARQRSTNTPQPSRACCSSPSSRSLRSFPLFATLVRIKLAVSAASTLAAAVGPGSQPLATTIYVWKRFFLVKLKKWLKKNLICSVPIWKK